ncbi:sulfurtransferase [Bacillus sp. 2CMS4F]|uniref:sulfurtransferase n=1 Tax=Bacillus sp. 2CMS4F TaxID=2929170 RepID=UPI0020C0C7F7|nr:sulfurtransferase [Bacillus sp. 2CMS4F]MCK8099003.1 sulfurtransferase [Bacillus sp. 2CMS4F]
MFVITIATSRRYYPIVGISCIHKDKLEAMDMTILDIRHYNDVPTFSDDIILNIPYAYLKRFYLEIPRDKIHIIAHDRVELNLGVRFLKNKGIHVNSYELATCKCKNKL